MNAPTIPETFRRIVNFLETSRTPYVVVGGLAAVLSEGPLPPPERG